MVLPALRASYLRGWSCAADVTEALRSQLLGRVIALPTALSRIECEETVDALAALLDMPARAIASIDAANRPAPPGEILVLPAPVQVEPAPVPGAVVVCSIQRSPPYLDPPQELMLLRDAVIQCWGLRHSGTRLQQVAVWLGSATDSAATALRFADGALSRYLADPQADDVTLHAAGLAAAIGWLLRGVDERVAQWVLVRALDAPDRARLVGTSAAVLGEDAALKEAFGAGLVLTLPQEPGDPLDLRRPLAALGELEAAPDAPPLAAVVEALRNELQPTVHAVLQRLLRAAPKGLGLDGPRPPKELVGRDDILRRLITLCEPANDVRTTVLYGLPGVGKSALAAALGEVLRSRLEPVWVRFDSGPEVGWLPVASALGVSTGEARDERATALLLPGGAFAGGGPPPRDAAGVPGWVREVHHRLRMGRYLIVVDGVNGVPEEELPRWLPSGSGRCSVLVLSETAQRPLQRSHDAIAMRLPELSREAARKLLAQKAPHQAEAILGGRADSLILAAMGRPGDLNLIGDALAHRFIGDVVHEIEAGESPLSDVGWSVLKNLSKFEANVMWALAVGAPQGSPPALPVRVAIASAEAPDALERLLDRGLAQRDGPLVRLTAGLREAVRTSKAETSTEDDVVSWRSYKIRHAACVNELLAEAEASDDRALQENLYHDLLLAVEQLMAQAEGGGSETLDVLLRSCDALSRHPRGDRDEALDRQVAGYRAALSCLSKDDDTERWAKAEIQLAAALTMQVRSRGEDAAREAIRVLEACLATISRERWPDLWALAQERLGKALGEHRDMLKRSQRSDFADVAQRAVQAFRAALTVRTRERDGVRWAWTQVDLGDALIALPEGDRAEHLQGVLDAYRAAMTVFTREQMPAEWATMQISIGVALIEGGWHEQSSMDRAGNVRAAIAAFEEALSVLSPETRPAHWLGAQIFLGTALLLLPGGSRDEHVRRAIEAYRAAASILTPEQSPEQWAEVQIGLGTALKILPSGDRAENLRQAIDAYRAALAALGAESASKLPHLAQQALEEASHELADLDPSMSTSAP